MRRYGEKKEVDGHDEFQMSIKMTYKKGSPSDEEYGNNHRSIPPGHDRLNASTAHVPDIT